MNLQFTIRCHAAIAAIVLFAVDPAAIAFARGGGGRGGGFAGGGARPSMGGGGARPSMASRPSAAMSRPSGGMSRPSMANATRPAASRPSLPTRPSGGSSYPSLSGISRPSGSRPATGLNRPSLPDVSTRPTLPGGSGRPSVRPGEGLPATTRPSFPGAGDIATRPTLPGRPGAGGEGTRLPNRPGGADRPSIPGLPDRPTIGGITRPGQGGSGTQRPGIANRPEFPNRPERPIIGGNRPHIGDNNIHIGDNININNRPGWGINRPGGDWWSTNHNWHDHWHDHCINPHYHWYHGCWNGHWSNYWWRPASGFFVGWGLGSWGSASYYNPYYVESSAAPYDYSQPIVVNNYASADDGSAAQTPAPTANEQAVQMFDDGLASFKAAQYEAALKKFDAALRLMPDDPVLHEVRALTLFALGQYQPAAAALNTLLASAPGMDWTTMSGLYGNVDDYVAQLRALEQHINANPNDAAAAFVLAYHYLVTGHDDDAVKALRTVVRLQPKDATAQRMLQSLAPPEPEAAAPSPAADPAASAADAPSTDLVGRWRAMAGDAAIELTITDDSQFTWKAVPKGEQPVELSGQIAATSDTLVLDSGSQGSMVGQVKSEGPDKFQFVISGSQPGDAGLSFVRQ